MAISQKSKILASDISGAIKSITRSGTTFTYTTVSGGTGTFTQQDNNTTYSAGTGLSLSSNKFSIANSGVTAGNYGPSANATPAYGATFNVPYITVDATGRVTAASTKTVKIPAAPSGGTASMLSGVAIASKPDAYSRGAGYGGMTVSASSNGGDDAGNTYYDITVKLPAGGTWRWIDSRGNGGETAGNTTIPSGPYNRITIGFAIAIRVA